ncbi:uncharacterized protein LOC109849752 isoform X2 [Asparagus officinalis]|uniref:uncharacterized protein LOC109849752 isoform X2 n=1 Tax=Asparagus officinalis TaxID=4686 RepID=UPI00098E0BCF|nr:uncharacterized protein LOC109849752 isoform X2 [Asparagus officinalis]
MIVWGYICKKNVEKSHRRYFPSSFQLPSPLPSSPPRSIRSRIKFFAERPVTRPNSDNRMGPRRKAKTCGSAYADPRNLSKSSLHGVIFGCNNNTMQECLSKQLFGLPSSHFLYVKNIEPGLPLFLFNYVDKQMHGIYEAASRGEMNIDPCAWTNNDKEKTGFPAQVCIRLQKQCEPITENQFKKVIGNNYYNRKKFWFELDKAQTEGLISLFLGSDDMSPTPGFGDVKSFKTSTPIKCNLPAKFGSASFEAAETGRTNEPPQFAGERLEYGNMRWQMIGKQPADPNFSSAFPNSGIDYHIPNMPGDINEGSMYPEETCVSVEKTIEITTDLCNDNAELVCIVKELKERAVTLEKRQMESEQEVQRLQNVVRCSGVEIQQLKSCVKELESKIMRSMESQNAIYLLGGFNGESWLSTLDSFSPSMDVLMPLKPMDSARAYASAAVLNGNFYVFGGGDGTTWFNTVECYSQRNNNWTSCSPLNRSKGSLAGATLNGKIFALGGGNGADSFSDVEIFDPALEKWIYNQPMLQKRFALAAGELCGVLYATGGFDGQDYLQEIGSKGRLLDQVTEHENKKGVPLNCSLKRKAIRDGRI